MAEQQKQRSDEPQGQRQRSGWFSRRLLLIITIIVVAIAVTVIWIISSTGLIPTILAPILSAVFGVFGVVIGLLSFFSVPGKSELTTALPKFSTISVPTSQIPSIVNAPAPAERQPFDQPAPSSILGLPPPTDPRTIQQREPTVKEIYEKLTQSDITALVLTGLGGVGKSTLAALLYHQTQQEHSGRAGGFEGLAIWLTINESVTMTDIAGTLFESLGKAVPNVGSMTPQQQAVTLFRALNTVEEPRLVILDQFENLLDWQTGQALPERPGVGEWLDALNSQPCRCRLLLTSRPWPQGTRPYPPTYLQEYRVSGLQQEEGVELLRKQGVQASETELRTAVTRCEGHAFSLTLLASLLRRNRALSLTMLLENPSYVHMWMGDIARNLLDYICSWQLSKGQRQLLEAFSLYREAVPLEAAQAVVNWRLEGPKGQLGSALESLLTQHLLQGAGEGLYRLHAIVASYAQEQASRQALQEGYSRAAQYYADKAASSGPERAERRASSDVHLLIEAVWQWCQAGQWQEAYQLIERERLFYDLNHWGGSTIILELCQLLLPLDRWQPQPSQAAQIYNDLGRAYNVLGDKEEALKYYEESLRIRREIGDREGEAITLSDVGWLYGDLRKQEKALKYLKQALRLHREVGDRRREGWALSHLGWIYGNLGKQKEALKNLEQALRILREVRDRRGEGRALNNLGKIYNALGMQQEALNSLEQALDIFRGRGDRRGEGLALCNLGRVYNALEDKEKALKYFEQALDIFREVGDREQEGRVLNDLGGNFNALEKKEQALRYFEQALLILRDVGDHSGIGTALGSIGTLYCERSRYDVALACLLLAQEMFEDVLSPDRDKAKRSIDDLREEVGKEQFAALLAAVQPQAHQIVEQVLVHD